MAHTLPFVYWYRGRLKGLRVLSLQRCSSKTSRAITIPQKHWTILLISSRNSFSYSPGSVQELKRVRKSVSEVGGWMGGCTREMANVECRSVIGCCDGGIIRVSGISRVVCEPKCCNKWIAVVIFTENCGIGSFKMTPMAVNCIQPLPLPYIWKDIAACVFENLVSVNRSNTY